MQLTELIKAARGEVPIDLLIKGPKVVNVLSGEIHKADVAVHKGYFLGFGNYEAREQIRADNKFICPGLIEGHLHIESTMLSPREFAWTVAQKGTCAVICDPHEIANVLGLEGIEYLLKITEDLPISIYLMAPSCVPATDMETSGASLKAKDLAKLCHNYPDRVLGLAELMNFPGVLNQDLEVLAKIEAAKDKIIDGHCPGLTGKDLNAYIIAGPGSDHETCFLQEAEEKLRKGMHLMIRQGSSEKNLKDLAPIVQATNSANISLVTDDRHPDDLYRSGHLDHNVRLAIQAGIPPILALQMVTINTARYFNLKKRGAIAPGYRADFLLLDDLNQFEISNVFLSGQEVCSEKCHWSDKFNPSVVPSIMNIGHLTEDMFAVSAQGQGLIKTIKIVPGQILTKMEPREPTVDQGLIVADPNKDICKLAVIERYYGTSNIGLGFVTGLGLKTGAIAGTVAHDSHNLIVAGLNDRDMLRAAQEVANIKGGLVVVKEGALLASLPLPLAGLMSTDPLVQVVKQLEELRSATAQLGCSPEMNIFMVLSFLALPVIPEIRLTDKGLVDVLSFQLTSLFC